LAEKFAVLIKYKYLEYIDNAKLSDAEAWTFIRGVIEYDMTGMEPEYDNPVMTGLFAVVKGDLDKNRKNWDNVAVKRSKSGKKGAAKRWARKEDDKNSNCHSGEEIIANDGKNSKNGKSQNFMAKMHGSGSGSDLASEFEFGSTANLKSSGGKLAEKPPQLLKHIKTESQNHGFFIDAKIAIKFQNCGIDPEWFIAPHSFLEYCALTVKKKYPEKQIDELKPLFISAVTEWDDRRDAFLPWRNEQFEKERKAAVKNARRKKPEVCRCGAGMNAGLRCKKCGGYFDFNEKMVGYEFYPKGSFDLAEGFKEQLIKKKSSRILQGNLET